VSQTEEPLHETASTNTKMLFGVPRNYIYEMKQSKSIHSFVWFSLFLTLVPTSEYSFAQDQDVRARKAAEYEVRTLRSEGEQMRIWTAFDELQKEREDTAVLVISYGPLPGSARRHAARVKSYLVNAHGVIPARVNTLDGGYRSETFVEIWIVPRGASIPTPTAHGSFQGTPNTARKYDELRLDGWWFNGRYERQSERLDGFANALKADPGSKGYIVVPGGTIWCETCLRPGTELRFARGEKAYLVREHRLAPLRISIIRGDRRNTGMEFWIVPRGAAPLKELNRNDHKREGE
jgi:hypothetical protein